MEVEVGVFCSECRICEYLELHEERITLACFADSNGL